MKHGEYHTPQKGGNMLIKLIAAALCVMKVGPLVIVMLEGDEGESQ